MSRINFFECALLFHSFFIIFFKLGLFLLGLQEIIILVQYNNLCKTIWNTMLVACILNLFQPLITFCGLTAFDIYNNKITILDKSGFIRILLQSLQIILGFFFLNIYFNSSDNCILYYNKGNNIFIFWNFIIIQFSLLFVHILIGIGYLIIIIFLLCNKKNKSENEINKLENEINIYNL